MQFLRLRRECAMCILSFALCAHALPSQQSSSVWNSRAIPSKAASTWGETKSQMDKSNIADTAINRAESDSGDKGKKGWGGGSAWTSSGTIKKAKVVHQRSSFTAGSKMYSSRPADGSVSNTKAVGRNIQSSYRISIDESVIHGENNHATVSAGNGIGGSNKYFGGKNAEHSMSVRNYGRSNKGNKLQVGKTPVKDGSSGNIGGVGDSESASISKVNSKEKNHYSALRPQQLNGRIKPGTVQSRIRVPTLETKAHVGTLSGK